MLKKIKNKVRSYINLRTKETAGAIYMLHRCHSFENNKLYPNENMKVSPEFLKNFIKNSKKDHVFISLDELVELKKRGIASKKKFIVMTFDDGYLDNLEVALPIFEELEVPFTVYITNCFPENTAFMWWYILEDLILSTTTLHLSNGLTFDCSSPEQKINSFMAIRGLILKIDGEIVKDEFTKLFSNYSFDSEKFNKALCMNWAQIQKLASSPFCTIGAHTKNHRALNKVSFECLKEEISDGKRELEMKLGKQVRHFAYPFGTDNEVGQREKEFIKTCLFNTVCMANGGAITDLNGADLLDLPRIILEEPNLK